MTIMLMRVRFVGLSQMIRYALENVQKDFGEEGTKGLENYVYHKSTKLTHFFQKTA